VSEGKRGKTYNGKGEAMKELFFAKDRRRISGGTIGLRRRTQNNIPPVFGPVKGGGKGKV